MVSPVTTIDSEAEVRGNWILKNVGGGISFSGGISPIIEGNVISENSGKRGGGVYSGGALAPKITNNLISGNVADLAGGGLWFSKSAFVANNIITHDTLDR